MAYCNILDRTIRNRAGEYKYKLSLNFDLDRPDQKDQKL